MTHDPVMTRARSLWRGVAGVPVEFGEVGIEVVVSPGSQLCPPSWAGVVVLGDAGIITAPTAQAASRLREVATALAPAELTDPERMSAALPVAQVLGPAALAYLSAPDLRTVPGGAVAESSARHPDVSGLLARVGREDADECGLDEITSPAFVIREQGEVMAAAGYQAWPESVAHLSVLTAPGCRGRGLARSVACVAVAHALDAGMLPQWRARPEPSRRVARALGFRELGAQLSLRLR